MQLVRFPRLTCEDILLVVGVATSLSIEVDAVADEQRPRQTQGAARHEPSTHSLRRLGTCERNKTESLRGVSYGERSTVQKVKGRGL